MIQEDLKKIEKIVKEFFEKTNLGIEVEVQNPQDLTIPIDLKTEEPQILIGARGQTLAEVQHLLKIILRKKLANNQPFFVDIDINDYKKKKIEYLKEMAKGAADEVVLTKKEKYLPVMAAYERRIVHLALAGRTDIITESIGQEPERKVVIRCHS